MKTFKYNAITPKQSAEQKIFCISATAKDVLSFAEVDRVGRNEKGKIKGFQRSKVLGHIKEIRDYLSRDDAVLPNSIVVAFTSGVEINDLGNGIAGVNILVHKGQKPGLIVDGQQRISALELLPERDFEVIVSCLICESEEELRRQFILVNNTRPLPKSLIYELLPSVANLPERLSKRSSASQLVELLNFDETSSLHGQIRTHTNPDGALQDTVFQRMLMHSLQDGLLRECMADKPNGTSRAFRIISEYFAAIQSVFSGAWEGHTAKSSRLLHGAGLIALGYVLEEIAYSENAHTQKSFEPWLEALKPICAWTDGFWNFGPGEVRKWNDLQVVPKDYMRLSHYLVSNLRAGVHQEVSIAH